VNTKICGFPREKTSKVREIKKTKSATYQGAVHVLVIGLMKTKLREQMRIKINRLLCRCSKAWCLNPCTESLEIENSCIKFEFLSSRTTWKRLLPTTSDRLEPLGDCLRTISSMPSSVSCNIWSKWFSNLIPLYSKLRLVFVSIFLPTNICFA